MTIKCNHIVVVVLVIWEFLSRPEYRWGWGWENGLQKKKWNVFPPLLPIRSDFNSELKSEPGGPRSPKGNWSVSKYLLLWPVYLLLISKENVRNEMMMIIMKMILILIRTSLESEMKGIRSIFAEYLIFLPVYYPHKRYCQHFPIRKEKPLFLWWTNNSPSFYKLGIPSRYHIIFSITTTERKWRQDEDGMAWQEIRI